MILCPEPPATRKNVETPDPGRQSWVHWTQFETVPIGTAECSLSTQPSLRDFAHLLKLPPHFIYFQPELLWDVLEVSKEIPFTMA